MENGNGPKTSGIGHYPLSVARKWKGWMKYQQAAIDMRNALAASAEEKARMKRVIHEDLVNKGLIEPEDVIDFNVYDDEVKIVRILREGKRVKRTQDLSQFKSTH